jgi:hypothetical protein
VTWRAVAYWIVVDDVTFRIDSTSAVARIFTFVVSACLRQWTICIDNTLGSTANKRVSKEALLASTFESFSSLTTLGIRSAYNVVTCYQFFVRFSWNTVLEGIANKTVITTTDGIVVNNFTVSVVSTRAGAWIDALLS